MATDWSVLLVQGAVQLFGTAIGGGIAAFTGFQVAERNARAAIQARADERAAQRDDHQRQVLTDLLDALGDLNESVGRELRDMQDRGVISPEASAASFQSGGRVERLAAHVRNQELRARVVNYRRFLLRLVLQYEPGDRNLLGAVNSILDSHRQVLDATHTELNRYL